MIRHLTIALVFALVGCHRTRARSGHAQAQADARSRSSERLALRERARATLRSACGECHDPDRPSAVPGALAVFDLSRPDWSSTMTDQELKDAAWRLSQDIVPTRGPKEMLPLHVPQADLDAFKAYVRLTRRARHASRLQSRHSAPRQQ